MIVCPPSAWASSSWLGAVYDSHHHWHSTDGLLNASVRFDAGGYSSGHIQGDPAALRKLAAALTLAADLADPAAVPARAVEGVAG